MTGLLEMIDLLEMLDKKIDEIKQDISEIKTHLAVYNEQLKIHIKRSDLLEEKLQPIENHVVMVHGIMKFIGLMAVIVAIIESISHILR